MKPLESRLSAGWSFAAGTLLGALTVFAVPAAFHNSRVRAEASEQRLPVAVEPEAAAPVLEMPDPARAPERDSLARSNAAGARKVKSGSPGSPQKASTHSELDLQLD